VFGALRNICFANCLFCSVQFFVLQGNVENYFVSGGFALTHENNVTDISVPEAFLLSDLDENMVKNSLAAAAKTLATEAEGSEAKAVAQIEVDTLSAMARALGVGGV
jgi:F0F1-type ATP synthase epsilon subunit